VCAGTEAKPHAIAARSFERLFAWFERYFNGPRTWIGNHSNTGQFFQSKDFGIVWIISVLSLPAFKIQILQEMKEGIFSKVHSKTRSVFISELFSLNDRDIGKGRGNF
jgi:hypothetical protein